LWTNENLGKIYVVLLFLANCAYTAKHEIFIMFTQSTVNVHALSFAAKNEKDKVHIDKIF